MQRMLDLFSGLGGASEAFVQSDDWEVVRIENNPVLSGIPETQNRDVLEWMDWVQMLGTQGDFDLIWASPPCEEFARLWMPWTRNKLPPGFEPSLELMQASRDIIAHYRPKHHVIENVIGAREYFKPALGHPAQVIDSINLWGRFPHITLPVGFKHLKHDVGGKNPLRSNHRALIPWEVSNGLLEAIESQWTLERYT